MRIAAASTVMAMLDGPASVFLQVAEFRESSRCGSFTALSSSLGHILMQLHSGIAKKFIYIFYFGPLLKVSVLSVVLSQCLWFLSPLILKF